MKNIKLRNKLLLIVMVSIIPMILLNSYMIAFEYKRAIDQELEANKDYAEAISVTYMNYLNKIWHAEYLIGQAIVKHSMNDNDIKTYLEDSIDDESVIKHYTWVSPEGRVIVSSYRNIKPGINISDCSYYKRILSGEEYVVSNLTQSKITEAVTILIARSIRTNGELKGIVIAGIDLGMLGTKLPENRLGKTSSFGLIDKNGMIVYRNRSPGLSLDKRQIYDDSPSWEALRGKVVLEENYDSNIDGSPRMGANVPIPDIGWASFASISTKEALGKINCQALLSYIFMFLLTLISLTIAIYLILDLLKPIRTLQKSAKAIASADFSFRTNLQRKDELGQTGIAFDKMAEHIENLEESRMLFLQTSAHELRNPMTSVKGISSLIHRTVHSDKPLDNFVQLIETLNHEVSRLSDLLNQILEAFCAERQNVKIKENMQPLNITDVINSAIKLYQMDTTNNRTIINHGSDAICILGDYHRLEDVIRNLLSNAVKYSPEKTEIIIDTCKEDSYVIISVKDEGIGIPEHDLTQIFNSFHRVNRDNNDPGGLGLGLYISRDIIHRHGGSIWAENNEVRGSTFFIKLPLYKNDNIKGNHLT